MNKSTKKVAAIVLSVAILFSVMGCQTKGQSTAAGAGIGAVLGAVLGYAIGGRDGMAWGAALGAAAGAATGYAYGSYLQQQTKDKTAVLAQNAQYDPDSPTIIVKDLKAEVSPGVARGGQEISLKASYVVLCPNKVETTDVMETRIVKDSSGIEVINKDNIVSVGTGEYETALPITLPNNMPRGNYEYFLQVKAGDSLISETSTIVVASAPDGKSYAYLIGNKTAVSIK